MFNDQEIDTLFKEINLKLDDKIDILLVGGGAMSLKGLKEATKDIDVVLIDQKQYSLFINAIENLGFNEEKLAECKDFDSAYRKMDAKIYLNSKGYWIDLFFKRICKKFLVHNKILERSELYMDFGNLRVSLMTNEDIFISKSVTERDGDLDDMYDLYIQGLDEKIIVNELDFQSKNSDRIWETFMGVKLDELEEKFDITIYFKESIIHIAENKMENELEKKQEI